MREILFRVWDNEGKGYINGFYMYGFSKFYSGPPKIQRYGSKWDLESVDVEQYTGLKDKNGKEIYEGDIVKTQNKYITKVVYGHNFDERGALRSSLSFMRVGLDEEYSKFKDQNVRVYSCGSSILYDLESLEIIGNIHQNQELLK